MIARFPPLASQAELDAEARRRRLQDTAIDILGGLLIFAAPIAWLAVGGL